METKWGERRQGNMSLWTQDISSEASREATSVSDVSGSADHSWITWWFQRLQQFDGVCACTHMHCANTNKSAQLLTEQQFLPLPVILYIIYYLFDKHLHIDKNLHSYCVLCCSDAYEPFLLAKCVHIIYSLLHLYLLISWLWMHYLITQNMIRVSSEHWKSFIRLDVSQKIELM